MKLALKAADAALTPPGPLFAPGRVPGDTTTPPPAAAPEWSEGPGLGGLAAAADALVHRMGAAGAGSGASRGVDADPAVRGDPAAGWGGGEGLASASVAARDRSRAASPDGPFAAPPAGTAGGLRDFGSRGARVPPPPSDSGESLLIFAPIEGDTLRPISRTDLGTVHDEPDDATRAEPDLPDGTRGAPTAPRLRADIGGRGEDLSDEEWDHEHMRDHGVEAATVGDIALRLPGAGAGRTVEVIRISGATFGARPTTRYRKAYFEARSVAEAALYDETISVRRKEHIRRYFEAIRPKD